MGKHQVSQDFLASLPINMYAKHDQRTGDCFYTLFCDKAVTVALVKDGRYHDVALCATETGPPSLYMSMEGQHRSRPAGNSCCSCGENGGDE